MMGEGSFWSWRVHGGIVHTYLQTLYIEWSQSALTN